MSPGISSSTALAIIASAKSCLVLKTTSFGILHSARRAGSPVQLAGRYSSKSIGHVGRTRRDAQADGDLAVGDFARGPGVLPLDTDGVRPLFEETRVVDDPRTERLLARDRVNRVARCDAPHRPVLPRRIAKETQQPMVCRLALPRVRRRRGGDRLGTLPVGPAEQPQRVGRERRAPGLVVECTADLREVSAQPAMRVGVELVALAHATRFARTRLDGKVFGSVVLPVPLSPVTSTVARLGATRSMVWKTRCIASLVPMMLPNCSFSRRRARSSLASRRRRRRSSARSRM